MDLCLEAVAATLLVPFQRISFLQRVSTGGSSTNSIFLLSQHILSNEGKWGLWKAAGLSTIASLPNALTDASTVFEHKRTRKLWNSLKALAPWEIFSFLWDSFFLTLQYRCWNEIGGSKTIFEVISQWKYKRGILSFFVCAQPAVVQVAIGLGVAFHPSFQRLSTKYGPEYAKFI